MIELRSFSAWITSDDMHLVEFEPRVDEKNKTVTCWIAGPLGKTFVVHWRDHGSRVDSASYIYFDGFKVSGQFLYGHGEELRRGIRVGPQEERPFVFSKIEAEDEIGYGTLKPHKNVGSIMLEIKQIQRTESYGLPQVRNPPSVIRGQRPEGEVCVRYGETRPAAAQMPTWKIQPHDPDNPGPFVTFIFRYRTHDWLVSQGIVGPDEEISQAPPSPWPLESPAHLLTPSSTQPMNTIELESGSEDEGGDDDDDDDDNDEVEFGAAPSPIPALLYPASPVSPPELFSPPEHGSLPEYGLGLLGVSPRSVSPRPETSRSSSLTSAFMSSIPLSKLSALPTYASSSTSRLKSLYADFTYQKQSNPTSYASNVEWWRRTLEGALLRGWLSEAHIANATPDRIVLHAPGVAFAEHFRVEGVGKPLSVPTVIDTDAHRSFSLVKSELCSSNALIPLSDFLGSSRSIYDPGWLPYRIASFMVGKPLWWALGQLGVVDNHADAFGDSSTAERWKKVKGDYVAVKLLEQAAEHILERQRQKDAGNLADSLYNAESFREEFAACAFEDALLSELDVKVLLKFLERDRRAVVVIKFVESGVSESADVTAVDSGLLALKTAVQKLHAQVDGLQRRIDERTRLASDALRQKRKETALTHLRARKQLEDVHKKRLGSLDLLEATLLRVETSAGDIDIMKSYDSSTATLREILSHPLLQREKIDETMDAMASANADAREIDSAIQMGADMAQADAGVDDDALEAELAALVQDVEKEKSEAGAEEQRKRLAAGGLDVPVHQPVLLESRKEVEAARKELEKVAV
ncbi:Snf7-domain-containing protein [Trametes gibbosa]|nr:Snf7-domain-containing protein [Trametes gibbosa]